MNPKKQLLLAAIAVCAVLPLVALFVVPAAVTASAIAKGLTALTAGGLFVGMAFGLTDEQVKAAIALPDGAAAVTTAGIDLGHGTNSAVVLPDFELEVVAPVLTTTELPNTETITYILQHDDASDFSGVATLVDNLLVQTGAGGAGAAAATARFSPPSTCKRYVRLKATNSGAGDCTGKTATLQGVF